MTLQEFVSKHQGGKIDYDGKYSGQCVDLYRQYVKEVLNFPQSPPVIGASEIFDSASSDLYEKIKNTPDGIPSPGDIVIWNKRAGGGYGHVAVFLSGNIDNFKSFDQNWKTLSVCEVIDHNYTNVTGWLHPKSQLSNTRTYTEEEFTKVRLERDNNWNMYQNALESNKTVIEKISIAIGCSNSIEAILARIESLNKLDDQLETARSEAKKQQEQHDQEKVDLQRQITELKQEVEKQQLENTKLLERLDRLESKVVDTAKKEDFLKKILSFLRL